MIAFAVTALFTIATFVALIVNATSLRRAWLAYGELRHALAVCETSQAAVVTVKSMEQVVRQPKLRPTTPSRRVSRPVPQQYAQRAAA